jgi:hypothetical protein
MRNTELESEFFLEISRIDGSKNKLIPIGVIEQFENVDGFLFNLVINLKDYQQF